VNTARDGAMPDAVDLAADLVEYLAEMLSLVFLAEWDESQRLPPAAEATVESEEAA
jgi:hypothetical protein